MGSKESKIEHENQDQDIPSTNQIQDQEIPKITQKINSNLIRNIISYLPLNLIATKCLTLNKKLYKLMKVSSLEVKKETKYELKGEQNMNKVYCEYDLDQIKAENNNKENLHFVNLHLIIQSKDQGWASVNQSSSWVELNIIDKNDKTILLCMTIVQNFKEKSYKKSEFNLKKRMHKVHYDQLLNQLNGKNLIIQVVARAMYPGWECHVKECSAKLQFFKIDLGD